MTWVWHILALLTACVWGSTFAASSILIRAGLSPAAIMCLRFGIAYLCMLPWCHRSIRSASWRDELLFVLLGLTGGSLYFLSENYAIALTDYTSTVALIVCTCPIFTAILNRLIWRGEHLSMRFMLGSAVALLGVSMVVLNGVFVLDDNPWVILLSFLAAWLWSIYSILLRRLDGRYGSAVVTRKVFAWGTLTMLPVCGYEWMQHAYSDAVFSTQAWASLLFLALVASLGAFWLWNVVCSRLTVVTASNYLYFNPVMSLLVGAWLLNEHAGWVAIVGCFVTIAGVYLCNRK